MTLSLRNAAVVVAFAAATAWLLFAVSPPRASAQFAPPQSLYGSINDPNGEIEEGTPVEAYIGDIECSDGTGTTGFTGVGDARVAVYVINVLSSADRDGCGDAGDTVRVKIGDEFVEQTATWEAGPTRLNVAFGEAPTVVLPTNTPVPPTNTPTDAEATAAGPDSTSDPSDEGTAGTPGTPGAPGTPGTPGTAASTAQGGLTGSTPGAAGGEGDGDDDDGGFPVWAIVVIGLAVLGAAGGGVGYLISRNNREPGLEEDF